MANKIRILMDDLALILEMVVNTDVEVSILEYKNDDIVTKRLNEKLDKTIEQINLLKKKANERI